MTGNLAGDVDLPAVRWHIGDVRTPQTDYLVNELAFVRQAQLEAARETRSLETYSLLASGAIWSWCISHQDVAGATLLAWAPLLITQLLGIRAWATYHVMLTMRRYVEKIERGLELPEGYGWERYVARAPGRSIRVYTAFTFWVALSLVNAGVGLFLTLRP